MKTTGHILLAILRNNISAEAKKTTPCHPCPRDMIRLHRES